LLPLYSPETDGLFENVSFSVHEDTDECDNSGPDEDTPRKLCPTILEAA
jgi:hypothetical protein